MKDTFHSDERIGRVSAPLLVLHGEADRVVPIRFGEALFALAREPKRFVRFPQGGHVDLDDSRRGQSHPGISGGIALDRPRTGVHCRCQPGVWRVAAALAAWPLHRVGCRAGAPASPIYVEPLLPLGSDAARRAAGRRRQTIQCSARLEQTRGHSRRARFDRAKPKLVTPMTMMVLAIRFYDVGLRDDAVFWFYVAKDRYIVMSEVLDVKTPKARASRRRHAQFLDAGRAGDQRLRLLRSRQAAGAARQGGRLGREQSLRA